MMMCHTSHTYLSDRNGTEGGGGECFVCFYWCGVCVYVCVAKTLRPLCVSSHTHTHTHTHTGIHTHTHTHTHTHRHTHTHTHTVTLILCNCACFVYVCALHSKTLNHLHSLTHSLTHSLAHSHSLHCPTHTHSHTYSHTQTPFLSLPQLHTHGHTLTHIPTSHSLFAVVLRYNDIRTSIALSYCSLC